jgi:hypothetical protein
MGSTPILFRQPPGPHPDPLPWEREGSAKREGEVDRNRILVPLPLRERDPRSGRVRGASPFVILRDECQRCCSWQPAKFIFAIFAR